MGLVMGTYTKKLNYSLYSFLIERIMFLNKLSVTLFSTCKES